MENLAYQDTIQYEFQQRIVNISQNNIGVMPRSVIAVLTCLKTTQDKSGHSRSLVIVHEVMSDALLAVVEPGCRGKGFVLKQLGGMSIVAVLRDLGDFEITPREYQRIKRLAKTVTHVYTEF